MSELTNGWRARRLPRWHLMVGASAAALLVAASTNAVRAEDKNRPTVWVELGGQLERSDDGQDPFAPPFTPQIEMNGFVSPLTTQRLPRYSTGFEGNLSLQPQGSDWVFTASIRYGRSNRNGRLHQEGPAETAKSVVSVPLIGKYTSHTITGESRRYADTTFKEDENYAIVDFHVGKDVGLGLFGRDSVTTFSAGLRIAQLSSRSQVSIGGDLDFAFSYSYPTLHFGLPGYFKIPMQAWHLNHSTAQMERSFHGVGPSVAWDTSAPIWGDASRGQVLLDFGMNGAILFGRQRANAVHQTTRSYANPQLYSVPPITYQPGPRRAARTRSVVVPNIGGQVGLSFAFPNAKVNLGYRADFFLNAVDGGIDTRKTYDRNFYGPYATISIGLGG